MYQGYNGHFMHLVTAIALGGALGAVLRHFAGSAAFRLFGGDFPYGTLAINVAGSFAIGLAISLLASGFPGNMALRGFLTVGLLGSFTTFSAFSMETMLLIERGEWAQVLAYVAGSVLLTVSGAYLGMQMGKAAL